MRLVIALSFFFFLASYSLMAQSSRDSYPPDSRGSTEGRKNYSKKRFDKKAFPSTFDQKIKEFEARKKAVAKRNKKMAKEMEKPQYSDPMYFGHKKPPKKRPVGKKKFCKECGMVH